MVVESRVDGILNGSWWNLICRFGLKIVDNLELIMCVAPAVQWYPLYGELFGDRVTDASRQTIERILRKTNLTPCLIPGGFSEATFTNAHPDVEYAYPGNLGPFECVWTASKGL